MATQKGLAFALRITDRATPPQYISLAGLTATSMAVASETIAVSAQDCAGWRSLLSGAGIRQLTVEAEGVLLGPVGSHRLRDNALAGRIDDYQLRFADGGTLSGQFLIRRLDLAGNRDGEPCYALVLESSGPIVAD